MANNSSWNDDETKTSISENDLEDNYYMILNLNKDATDKEITQAYHRFGLLYHPDKHKDPENKRNAEILFSKIKKAYDVLINAHKRAIYDNLGIKGLEQDGLQIVIRSKTPQEIREEYERISREREEKLIESLTSSQGSFTVEINATNIFDSFSDIPQSDLLDKENEALINIGNFSLEQYIDIPISKENTVSLGGVIRTNGKFGGGSIVGSFRRILSSDTYLNFKFNMGANNRFDLSYFKRLSQKLNSSLSGQFRYKNGAIAPIFTGGLTYQLDDHLIGSMQYKTSIGFSSSMTTALVYEKDDLNLNASVQLSVKNTYLNFGASYKFNDNDIKLKTQVQYGFLGAILSYGVEKQLTKYSRLDASMIVNSVSGVALNLSFERGSQQFILPIHLSHEVTPSAIFYGTVTPLIVYFVVKRLVLDPYQRNKEEKEAKQKQDKLKFELIEKRRLALAAQELMKETVNRVIEKEGPNGLIIKNAIYGKIIDKNNPNFDTEKIVDIRIPLQFLVSDHNLQILSDQSKSNLEGFYDPCVGETKSLYIEYTFNNENYQVTFEDNQIVRLPKSSHKIEKWWSRSFNNVR